nr:Gfo/Idh/MocA family oxidoreductase [Natrononativus amylolyticus]
MAYRHAEGYDRQPACRLTACADIVAENARAFAERNGIDDGSVFTEYERMLEATSPDVVSVCTPVPTHADIVVACAEHEEGPSAIHCEKPMAVTMADSRRMTAACDREGVQLTFNHQRRVSAPSRRLVSLAAGGAVGDVERIELTTKNLFDSGTHFIDLCNAVLEDRPAEWVLGAIDYRVENVRYGVHNDNEAFVRWRYEGGVDAVAAMGDDADFIDCDLRVLGTDGAVELNPPGDTQLRCKRGETEPWEEIHTGEPFSDIPAAIDDVIEGLETGAEPELSARRALAAMEIILAGYESSRRRGRVDLPLEIDDNPLVALVESGELTPQPQSQDRE